MSSSKTKHGSSSELPYREHTVPISTGFQSTSDTPNIEKNSNKNGQVLKSAGVKRTHGETVDDDTELSKYSVKKKLRTTPNALLSEVKESSSDNSDDDTSADERSFDDNRYVPVQNNSSIGVE